MTLAVAKLIAAPEERFSNHNISNVFGALEPTPYSQYIEVSDLRFYQSTANIL
jgi:hypothetical protein